MGHAAIELGAKVPNSGPLPGRLGIGAMARRLEDAGFASLWVSDHVVMPAEIESRYPFAADGRATWPTDTPYYDAIIALTLIAAATASARFGPAVLVLPQREPIVTAKQLASLDAVSGGRLELGVGSGWLREEFEALNVPFATRGSRTDDWIALLRETWSGAVGPHDGPHHPMPARVLSLPRPAHRIPILVGGDSPAAFRRAGAVADGWLAHQSALALDADAIADGVRRMREAAQAAGADPGARRVVLRIIDSAGRADTVAAAIPPLARAGVQEIVVDVDWDAADGPAEAFSVLRG
jgi:probable F420-dependent oxidoreductase